MKIAKPFWDAWGFKRNPFGNIESADDVFEGREMERVGEYLVEAVEEGGIYAVTGERGIGKTTVKNEVLNFFDQNKTKYAYSVLECVDLRDATMSTIHAALIADLSNEKPKANSEHKSRQVTRILGELAARKKVVLVIDEAQRLPLETMEKLKMLTERRWAFRSKLITVLLFGQPELTFKLSRDEGLNLRVTQYQLRGFNPDETLQYIDLRCKGAGGDMRAMFDPEALEYIAENQHSPLHINHVCTTCMRMARRTGDMKITLAMVYESGGIRSPRQILRDNSISVRDFSVKVHVDHHLTGKLLDGDTTGTTPEQQERFRQGLRSLTSGGPMPEKAGRAQEKMAASA
jgi:type II secretory pathway predicted ATPase ExeA